MKFDIVTIFPKMVEAPLAGGIVGRAIERGVLDVKVHDLRDFTTDRHRVVDDVPFGGGPGMVLKPEPIFRAVDELPAPRVGLVAREGVPLEAVTEAATWVVGAEREGVPADVLAACDAVAHIPIQGASESLNAAMAATVALYESHRIARRA